MRRFALLLVFCFASFVQAADLHHLDFKIGLAGTFTEGRYAQTVKSVVDKNTVIVVLLRQIAGQQEMCVIMKMNTTDLADGSSVDMSGNWKITKTQKIKGKTMFVFERVE